MRRMIGSSLFLVAVVAGQALAQVQPAAKQSGAPAKAASAVTWASLAGDWEGKSTRGTSDSVITTSTLSFTADKKAYVKYPDRDKIELQNVVIAGDSVTYDAGPYDSITRPGHKVTTHNVLHVANHKMTGTFAAKFDDGQTLTGRFQGSHKLK
jgi:hypothetical protein